MAIPMVAPAGFTYIATIDSPVGWKITWFAGDGVTIVQTDPIVGWLHWKDTNNLFRVSPLAYNAPVIPEQQTQTYALVAPDGSVVTP